jgi:hypothetical protein
LSCMCFCDTVSPVSSILFLATLTGPDSSTTRSFPHLVLHLLLFKSVYLFPHCCPGIHTSYCLLASLWDVDGIKYTGPPALTSLVIPQRVWCKNSYLIRCIQEEMCWVMSLNITFLTNVSILLIDTKILNVRCYYYCIIIKAFV